MNAEFSIDDGNVIIRWGTNSLTVFSDTAIVYDGKQPAKNVSLNYNEVMDYFLRNDDEERSINHN